jgi:hypothetical protein
MGNLYDFSDNLVLSGLLVQNSLELPEVFFEGFELGRPDDVLIDPYRFRPALGQAPSPVKQQRRRNTMPPSYTRKW